MLLLLTPPEFAVDRRGSGADVLTEERRARRVALVRSSGGLAVPQNCFFRTQADRRQFGRLVLRLTVGLIQLMIHSTSLLVRVNDSRQ